MGHRGERTNGSRARARGGASRGTAQTRRVGGRAETRASQGGEGTFARRRRGRSTRRLRSKRRRRTPARRRARVRRARPGVDSRAAARANAVGGGGIGAKVAAVACGTALPGRCSAARSASAAIRAEDGRVYAWGAPRAWLGRGDDGDAWAPGGEPGPIRFPARVDAYITRATSSASRTSRGTTLFSLLYSKLSKQSRGAHLSRRGAAAPPPPPAAPPRRTRRRRRVYAACRFMFLQILPAV